MLRWGWLANRPLRTICCSVNEFEHQRERLQSSLPFVTLSLGLLSPKGKEFVCVTNVHNVSSLVVLMHLRIGLHTLYVDQNVKW